MKEVFIQEMHLLLDFWGRNNNFKTTESSKQVTKMKIEDEIKGNFRNEYHKGLINMNYTIRKLEYEFIQSLKKHGLTEPQYNVLRILHGFTAKKNISISFIKERMLDKNSDVSRIVDKLFSRNLVKRTENKTDRRQKNIEISKQGIDLLNKMFDCEKKADTLLKNLTLEEVKELNRLLDKIRD